VNSSFELFVAGRYLLAKRKQAVISVITVISILGVAAGVMALVIALAITSGFHSTLQRNLLGATAHVRVVAKEPGEGIENWRELSGKLRAVPHVTGVSPTLYDTVLFSGPMQSSGGVLKGIIVDQQQDVLAHLKQGSIDGLRDTGGMPGIILGSRLAQTIGMMPGSVLTVLSPQGVLTPAGLKIMPFRYRVAGIFETGFYELDAQWAYASLKSVQMVLSVDDVVNAIELKVDDVDRAPEIAKEAEKIVGKDLIATSWMEDNRQVMNALQMERIVTVITVGLIQLVGALNILIALIMMVMEKYRDIAIFMSMGARHQQIRKIFMLQGVLIGVVGTVIGLTLGYSICYFGDKYRWISLPAEVYSISYVPFEARSTDGLWIAAVAIGVSFIATLYPARNATKITPVEALRYQ
jgi:lipoprotein-releasing system permease protein